MGVLVPIAVCNLALTGLPPCTCAEPHDRPELFAPLLFARPLTPELPRDLLAFAAHAHLIAWDLRVVPEATTDPSALRAMARFAALDLGVKLAHLRRVEGGPTPAPDGAPAWAVRKRRGEPVSRLLRRALLRSSREVASEKVAVSVETLKSWQNGRCRPCAAGIRRLVSLLPDDERERAFVGLRRHYTLSAVGAALAQRFGSGFVEELGTVVEAVASCRHRVLAGRLPEVHDTFEFLFLPFSWWLLSRAAFLGAAEHHAPVEWFADVERALAIWQLDVHGSLPDCIAQVLTQLSEMHRHELGRTRQPRARVGGRSGGRADPRAP